MGEEFTVFAKCISKAEKNGNIRIAVEIQGAVTDTELIKLKALHKEMISKAEEILNRREGRK